MAKTSLFAKQQQAAPSTPGTALALPTPSSMATIAPPEPSGPSSNYVWFAGRKSPKWADYAAMFPELQANDAILILQEGDPVRLGGSLSYFLLDAFQYFAQLGGEAENFAIKRAWTERPDKMRDNKIREFLSMLVVVIDGEDAYPATLRVGDAMARGGYDSIKAATVDAVSPDWAKKSADHAETLKIPHPHMRFKTRLTWKPRKSQGGNTYFQSSSTIIPTSIADVNIITAESEGDDFQAEMKSAKESFDSWRQNVIEKK